MMRFDKMNAISLVDWLLDTTVQARLLAAKHKLNFFVGVRRNDTLDRKSTFRGVILNWNVEALLTKPIQLIASCFPILDFL